MNSAPHSPLPVPPHSLSHYLPAIAVGAGCALLYTAIARGLIHGILIGYVPMLLVFGLGWIRGSKLAISAVLTATLILMLLAPGVTPAYLALDALPTLLILRLSLTYFAISLPHKGAQTHLLPAFSTGQVLTALCLYAAGILLLGLLALSLREGGAAALPEPLKITTDIATTLAPLMQSKQTPEALAATLLPLLPWMLGGVLWLWILAVWGVAALAYFLSFAITPPAPRSLSLLPFRVPIWILGLLAILGAFASGSIGWNAIALKSAFFLLLLPYFLSGVSIILPKLPAGAPRRIGVAGLIFGLLIFPWAALIFIAIGLFHPLQSRSSNS